MTHDTNSCYKTKSVNVGSGNAEFGKIMADRRSKSFKGAVMLGSSKPTGVPIDGHFDKKKGQNAPSLKPKKGSAKMVRRPLFQDPNTANVEALTVTGAAVLPLYSAQVGDGARAAVAGAAGARSDDISGAEPDVDYSALVPS